MTKRQIHIDENKIKETQIVINVKTLIIIVGVMISTFSSAYFMLSSQISDTKHSVETEVKDTKDELKKNIDRVDDILREDYRILDEKITFILRRTNSRSDLNTVELDTTRID